MTLSMEALMEARTGGWQLNRDPNCGKHYVQFAGHLLCLHCVLVMLKCIRTAHVGQPHDTVRDFRLLPGQNGQQKAKRRAS